MRMNVEIDEDLMADALAASGLKTKRTAVEEGLRLLVATPRQGALRDLRGTVDWHGDPGSMRRARHLR